MPNLQYLVAAAHKRKDDTPAKWPRKISVMKVKQT
jgi:hypothetical protein